MSLRRRIQTQDARLLRRLAAPGRSGRARLTQRLVPLADHQKAWLLSTPVLVALDRRGRRAVLAGWEAVAVATMLSKAVEVVVRRRRPGRPILQHRVTAGRRPSSSSFPSNHATTAVAFAGAASLTFPPAGWALAPLAGFVALSRPLAGRHYPSDVVGGVVAGAVAAAMVHRWGPGRNRRPSVGRGPRGSSSGPPEPAS